MLTLSYGYKKPETNDKGPIVFPALEDNIQQLNDHTHDGSDSAQIPSSSILPTVQTLLAADWVSLGGGNYHQQVNIQPGFTFDLCQMSFRNPDGSYVFPSVTRVSDLIFDVTSNDNTIDMKVYYGV